MNPRVGLNFVSLTKPEIWAVSDWGAQSFGDLDPQQTLRLIVPAVLSLTLGFQTILSSFFLSVLGLGRQRDGAAVD